MIALAATVGLAILLPFLHLAVWSLIPPLSPRKLARTGQFISVNGVETYYERKGSGPPLILIPAGGSHTSTWRFNLDALSQSHDVCVLDLPGSGYTDKPATFPYTHRSYAEFVRDFMTAVGIPKAALAGQSLGGTVALEFALDFPELTAGVILIGSGGYPRGDRARLMNFLRHPLVNATLMSLSSYPPVVKALYRYIYFRPDLFVGDTALIAEACDINRTPHARQAYYWMQRGLGFDFAIPDVSRIKSVSAPTLLLWGREDRVVGVETAERFHHDIAQSHLVVVDGAGHMVHEEKPEAVNHAILDFLNTLGW